MKGSTKNILVLIGTLVAASYVYNRYVKNRVETKMLLGSVDACNEMAANMRFPSDEAKNNWLNECVKKDGVDAPVKPLKSNPITDSCIEAANNMRFSTNKDRELYLANCVQIAGGI